MTIVRLDIELVTRGLARSRGRARELIASGHVKVDGRPVTKASTAVEPGQQVQVAIVEPEWVGRGALKMVAALDRWPVRVQGRRCLDVGASTGGFTQVLLARGAEHVVALDVGHDQLHPSLSADPRVTRMDGVSIRGVDRDGLGGGFGLVVADLSFISLTLVLGGVAELLDDGRDVEPDAVLLVKPQFEVGRQRLGRRGLVTDPGHRRQALVAVLDAGRAVDLHPHGVIRSPIPGGTGNVEYLVWLRPEPSEKMGEAEVLEALSAVTQEGAP